MARAARLHYEFDLTHQEVATTLGLSRVKVTRMLKKARQVGLVQITVLTDLSLFITLEEELASRFGLMRAVVVPDSVSHEETPLSGVARGGATFLNQLARDDLVVAVGLSRAVAEIPRWLGIVSPARIQFVSLVGASRAVGGTRRSPYLATDALATAYCGTAEHLHAPAIVRSRSMAEELVLEPSVAEPLARAAVAAGADGVFLEVHPDPEHARSDAAVQLDPERAERLLKSLIAIRGTL